MTQKPNSRPYEPSEEEILQARQMARRGATLNDIHAALNWGCHIHTTQSRLRKAGVMISRGSTVRRAHFGDETTLSKGEKLTLIGETYRTGKGVK